MPKRRKKAARRTTTRRRATTTARRRTKRKSTQPIIDLKPETRRQINGWMQVACALVLLLVLQNRAGMMGEWLLGVVQFLVGGAGVFVAIALAISGVSLLLRSSEELVVEKDPHAEVRTTLGLGLATVALLGFIHVQAPIEEIMDRSDQLGGAVGFMVAFPLLAFTSQAVAYVVLSVMLIVGVLIACELTVADIVRAVHAFTVPVVEESAKAKPKKPTKKQKSGADLLEGGAHVQAADEDQAPVSPAKDDVGINIIRPEFAQKQDGQEVDMAPKQKRPPKAVHLNNEDDIEMKDTRFDDWEFPPLDSLDPSRSEVMVDDKTLQEQAQRIAQKLKEFDVHVTMRDAHPGPTVTQFTLEPSEGVKLSRIANLKNDLALALAAPSLRIEAPIPGKSLVGIEMPNEKRTIVHLREMLESAEFRESTSPLSLPLGRDVSGCAIVEDLAEMPHLMIAGATGAGKSVGMNTFLMSLLFQNAPHELKFILIDPKRVELAPYDGIPHLLTPVITEADRALKALRWVVAEMGRRLARFAEVNARNLAEFNEKQDDETKQMPRIVVVIDELADLMMRQYRRDTETMITRIAQIARATGIHLILATQRPSVDVITGIIKANIPTRIAFRTVSAIDSRTILDSIGSEDLLGKGDMLYTMASTPVPMRVQGVYVSGKEVERVINHVKIAGGGQITAEIPLEESSSDSDEEDGEESSTYAGVDMPSSASMASIDLDSDDDGGDDLTFEAIELVQRTGKASASLLQRHLKVGYARAARILDILEEKGVVGPADGAKPRKIYVQTAA